MKPAVPIKRCWLFMGNVKDGHEQKWNALLRRYTRIGSVVMQKLNALLRRYTRVGSVVMLLHDPSEIFLEGAKLADYAGLDGPAAVLFAGLVVSWALLRLGLLPLWIIRSCKCAPPP